MAYGNIKPLIASGTALPTSVGSDLYAAPTNKAAEIISIWLHNTDTLAQTVTIYLGGTTNAHKIVTYNMSDRESFEISPKIPFIIPANATPAGKGLFAICGQASKINMVVQGREEV
jgi:hypothetical protein